MTTVQAKQAAAVAQYGREEPLSPDFLEAFQRLVGEVFRLNGELLAAGERLGRDVGISPARWQVIATIRNEPMTVAEIGRRLGLTRQSIRRTVKLLAKEGLVRTRQNPNHRRSHLVALTRRGRQVMDKLRRRQVPLTGMFTHELGLDVDDLDRLTGQLEMLRETAQRVARD
ncbi:MAG: MarR family transcriptional regulator [Gammaproteobacteria bacterium]|nr:MarR family transcriptional regulator [Gammaproteobacteria bacterium]